MGEPGGRQGLRRALACALTCASGLATLPGLAAAAGAEPDAPAWIDANGVAYAQIALFTPLEVPREPEHVRGVRLNLLYGRTETLQGLDLGSCNRVRRDLAGVQLGLANATDATARGAQVSLGNEARATFEGAQVGVGNLVKGGLSGLQVGVANRAAETTGLQIGLANRAERLRGLQLGLFNIHDEGGLAFLLPFVNAGW